MKTHVDIIEDFQPALIERLQELSVNHDFVIFEDRKFADIGSCRPLSCCGAIHE